MENWTRRRKLSSFWHRPGPWKRVVATRVFFDHDSPAPHHDAVESVIDYRVPPEKVSDAAFDGSVIVQRTAAEVPRGATTREQISSP
ncbi:hypothetical protein [Sinorhizobium alkalisoli]|uniref:hypothetical protein n=1 Tax=Sinorhizobium alkalisoli TaxID=1752398 RepID=UPI001FDA45AA|nr:hypothetical protein [Sinorhizobium alkalisoli]